MRGSSGRARLAWSVAVGLVALTIAAVAALSAYRRAVTEAERETEAVARDNIEQALFLRSTGGEDDLPANTWTVNPVDGWADPFGDTWTDPPLFSLAEQAIDGASFREYDFEGQWLAYSFAVGDNQVLVTAVDRAGEDEAATSALLRWGGLAVALAAVAGGGAYLALGRLQAPVNRAHAVNRDFIADAAHELRTPLSIIQASAGFALARPRSDEEYRESLGEILDASERAGSSVGELLELARLEAGQASLRLAPLRLDLLVEEVAASVRVEGTTIEPVPTEAVVVEADYGLLRQAIDNITRNAAARADKVSLTTAMASRQAVIEVVDDGPGFDPGIIDHVFERFRRGDRSGAVGLGMAIASNIVELHGGSCQASNRPAADGGGAVVTIQLPFKGDG